MAGNNEFNLVISDEEGANHYTDRTQNTLNQHGSPGVRFVRQTQGHIFSEQPHKNMTSPISHETIPSYEKEYGLYPSEGHMPFHTDDTGGLRTNSESYSGIQLVSNIGNSTKAQFIKKTKKPTLESHGSEDGYERQVLYGGTFAAPNLSDHLHPREYMSSDDVYAQYPDHERYPEEYGEIDDNEAQRELFQDEEHKAQSLRGSKLSGLVRYSKMSEEETTRAFENRKKELFSTYLKKGPKKAQVRRAILLEMKGNAETLEIFLHQKIPMVKVVSVALLYIITEAQAPASLLAPN